MMLSDDSISALISIAERGFHFQRLQDIYREIPQTICQCCGECCRHGPRVYMTEYLHIYRAMKNMSHDKFSQIVKKTIRYGFLSLVDTSLTCPFLEGGKCIIYDHRAFNCRTWGHSSEEEYYFYIKKARKELESERDFWLNHFEIQIPDSIVHGHKTFCTDMKLTGTAQLTTEKRKLLEGKIERLENLFIQESMVPDEGEVLELPLFICFTFIGSARFFNSRPRVMKEYLENGNTGYLEELITIHFNG